MRLPILLLVLSAPLLGFGVVYALAAGVWCPAAGCRETAVGGVFIALSAVGVAGCATLLVRLRRDDR